MVKNGKQPETCNGKQVGTVANNSTTLVAKEGLFCSNKIGTLQDEKSALPSSGFLMKIVIRFQVADAYPPRCFQDLEEDPAASTNCLASGQVWNRSGRVPFYG